MVAVVLDGHPVQALMTGGDTSWSMLVTPDQLDGRVVVDPIRAVQRGRGKPRHDAASPRPHPRRGGTSSKRQLRELRQMNVGIDRAEPSAQLIRIQPPLPHSL
jgi:hypothetical protein